MGTEGTGQDTGGEQVVGSEPEQGSGLNPAWNDLLEVVPSQLHSQVTPHLEKWDRNYQESLNKVHSQYDPYQPYVDNNIAPDQINYALQLMQAIEARPAEVIKALQEYAGLTKQEATQVQAEQQGQVDAETEVPDFINHPEFQKMNKMVETMAQLLVQRNLTEQQSQEDQQLSAELEALHQSKGEFDEEWVLTRALNHPNESLEKHVDAYKEFVNGIISNTRKPGPRILSAGGIAPNNQLDPKTLDDKERRGLVAQMLQAAAQNNG